MRPMQPLRKGTAGDSRFRHHRADGKAGKDGAVPCGSGEEGRPADGI